jgi:predicted CXXCH cytochrome family protein
VKARIVHIIRKRRGMADQSEQVVEAPLIRVGRGAASEIYLADPQVRLEHAVIDTTPSGPVVRAAGDATVLVDGRPTALATVGPGQRISVGRHDLTLEPAPPGYDLAVSVELVRPFDAEAAAALTDRMRRVSAHLPSRRITSWVMSLLILVLFLAVPVIAGFSPAVREATKPFQPFASWNPGTIANVHRGAADSCTTCHARPFVRVENAQCLACHVTTRQHADPKFLDLNATRCETCHKEHNGVKLVTRTDDALCAGCHGRIAVTAPGTTLLDVTSFATAHPEFRPKLVTDPDGPVLKRVALDMKPVEKTNLRFPHDKHLNKEGVRTTTGVVKLDCANCHVPEPGGGAMKPVSFERNCAACHTLAFERRFPDWTLPHGEPDKVRRTMLGLYSQLALAERKGVDRAAPARQRPGEVSAEEKAQREADVAWVEARTEEAMASSMGPSGCGLCHATERKADGWAVRPVHVHQRYMEKARFSHARHVNTGCGECHAAQTSANSEEVLMPGIETCRGCHGDETPTANKVASSCLSCHAFHTHPVPMRSAEAGK